MTRGIQYSTIATSLVISALVVTAGFILMRRSDVTERDAVPIKSMKSWQHADAPLGYRLPTNQLPALDTRFIELSAFERAAIPTSTKNHHSMGSINGALTYNAQSFWDLNERRGGHHTGDDINGIGGMNSDLGDPIFATSNSMVIYRGEPSPGWGKILILAHKDSEGEIFNTMYAHLDKSYSPFGFLIPQGEIIGTVGTANNNYPAHLHLELRSSSGVYIGGGYRSHPGESLPAEKDSIYGKSKPLTSSYKNPLSIISEEYLLLNQAQVR